MAAFPLAAAAAGARVVPASPGVRDGVARHQVGSRPARAEQAGHRPHRLADMVEEILITRAQIMQPWFAVGRGREPVLRAAAVAREPDIALQAVPGQRGPLCLPELLLLGKDN